ncbi:MAG: hypothetical protein ACR2H3_04330 [Acidimicrobiales bacterium]
MAGAAAAGIPAAHVDPVHQWCNDERHDHVSGIAEFVDFLL